MRFAVIMAAAMLAAGAARATPLEAYGKLPSMEQVAISPDGTKVAFVQQVNGKYALVVDQLDPAAIVIELPPNDQKMRQLIWADPTHLLVVKSQTVGGDELYMAMSLDIANRKSTALLSKSLGLTYGSTAIAETPEVRSIRGHPTVFMRPTRPMLISSDLITGEDKQVEILRANGEAREWVLDDSGVVVAQENYDQYSRLWTLRLKKDGKWQDAYVAKALTDIPKVLGLGPDGSALLMEIPVADGPPEHRLLSLADGRIGEPQAQYDAYAGWLYAPQSQRIIGGVTKGMEPTYVFFDPKEQASWGRVVGSFPGEQVDLVDWSQDRSKIVVRVTGPRHGVAYEVVDFASLKASEIGQAFAGIKPDDLADVNIATYPAKDGLSIQAFLTLPTGRTRKNLPLIVLPHGGPGDRDEAGFNWWAQALASRGYAVLQPQFRGSTGLGWKLQSAGFGEYGRKMQSDLSDGVRALAASGYIDPKRVCIVGASFGGYAALAGVTIEQGIYRCAVSVSGISDFRKLTGGGLADEKHNINMRLWDRYVGAKGPTDSVYDLISPVRHAAQADAPILLIHGKDDAVVPIDQTYAMESALKRANKPAELVVLPNEDHWLSREATRVQMLQATVKFLEKYNPPN
jgi:dipeptidyl aminopeptidase/acylaminoacyl peptidase